MKDKETEELLKEIKEFMDKCKRDGLCPPTPPIPYYPPYPCYPYDWYYPYYTNPYPLIRYTWTCKSTAQDY